MKKPEWIPEKEAAKKAGLAPRYFRAIVKRGTLNISYRTRPSGRGYEYDAAAIEKVKNENAVLIS